MDETFDPIQAGAVAVQESAPFDPVSVGAVPVKEEEPSFLQKAGRALVQGVEKMLPSFKEAYPQATLEQALTPFPIQQAQQGIQLGQEAYQATTEPLGSQKQLNAVADIGLAFAPLLLPELPRVFKGFRPSLAETFHGVPETPTPVADAAEAEQVTPTEARPIDEPVPTEPQVAAANIEAAPMTQEPQGFPASQEPFPSISQSAEEQRRVTPEQTPPVREAISLDELRLMRERNELQMQNDIAKRVTGGTHPAVDERIGQIETQLNDIANRELQQKGGGELQGATQEGQVPESNIPEYQGNGEGRPPAETGGGGVTVPSSEVTGQEAIAPQIKETPAAEIPPSPAVAESAATKAPEARLTTETTGIAERYREEQQPGSVIPGTGVTSEQAKTYGQDFINKGNDPYMAVRRAQAGNTSWRDVGVARAEYDRLGNEKRAAEDVLDKDPNNPQLQEAFNKADDAQRKWSKDAQPILTRAGDALRAATRSYPREINSFSDFTDIVNDHFNGEVELTPEKRAELQKATRQIKQVNQDATNTRARVTDAAIQKAGGRTMSFDDLKSDLNGAVEKLLEDCPI